jgi:hypothetical protein
VPSATPSSENADRTALPTGGHAGDRHPIAAPEAADDDDPVPMSGEVREPGRSLELVEEVPQQWERAGNFFHEARHRGTTIRHGGKLINSLHQGSIFSLKCDHQPAHDGVERLLPSRPKFRIDRQRLIERATMRLATGLPKPRSTHAQYHHGCQPKTRDDSPNLCLVAPSRL